VSRIRMAATAGLALVLAGCGAVGGTGGAASGSSTTTGPSADQSQPPSSSTASTSEPNGKLLTTADNGTTVTVVLGQQLTVELAPGTGAYAWDPPRLTGSSLQLISVAGGYPSRDVMRAVFLAAAPGPTVVSSTSDTACLHARPRCMLAQRIWRAQVIVRPSGTANG
jgi:hypothetical protein